MDADRAVSGLRTYIDARGHAPARRSEDARRASLEAELARTLLERTEELAREAREIAGILNRASARLGGTISEASDATWRSGAKVPFARRANDGLSGRSRNGAGEPGRADARGPGLVAAQMAAAGSTRQEITERLAAEFGVADPSDVLRGVLDDED